MSSKFENTITVAKKSKFCADFKPYNEAKKQPRKECKVHKTKSSKYLLNNLAISF